MKKFLKFSLIGILNTFITIISYIALIKVGINYLTANCFAYLIGVINSYYWNKNWVFEFKNKEISLFLKFLTVNIIVLTFNTINLFILVDKLFINKFISQLVSISVGMIMNFFLNKLWTFNKQNHLQ
ncbi:GtrA family protein [Bacillus cereus]|uniref:GtrA family protein n=1 Tax=Bacillus cereus group TaxID=86661 RepID=UPI00062CFC7E|nr:MULTISPECIES: GtrA family protein [Bacillus cereus group]AMR05696.1 sugar translocase [Bacillus thuringiensis]MBJ8204529.1 GtrA family protein [Bacillus cereus]MDA2357992.1 GtrA family protein [Bacillus cereus]PNK36349.1 GtrA family protein [Bacillus thuringiensis]